MSKASKWHGWMRLGTNCAIHVGPLPGRKGIALYVVRGAVLSPLAYFRGTTRARMALDALDELLERFERPNA